jgi:hypothetical protein
VAVGAYDVAVMADGRVLAGKQMTLDHGCPPPGYGRSPAR